MLVGAILNIVIDPIFIFDWGLNMGVRGAAIATIFSQFVTFLLNVLYIRKFKTIKLTKETFKPDLKIALTIAKFGISSFITQMAIVVVITVQNILFNKYGELSRFGAEIPITVLGIVMKINQILSSIIIGISAGSQPIVGFNYGAKKYDRVKKTLKIVLGSSLVVSIIGFILFQTIPEQLIGIFGSGDELYNEFACIAFRVFLMLTLFNGIQTASGIFFQAIGKPGKSAFLTLSRQILFFVPSAIILSRFFDVMGVIYAGPVADGLAFIIAVILLVIETKKLGKNADASHTISTDNVIMKPENNIIVTVAREYGSGGRYVAKLLAEKLGIKFYDKKLIEIISNESGLSAEYIEENEQNIHGNLLSSFNTQYYNNLSNDDNLFIAESKAIKEIADSGACVIVGNALKEINRINKNREKHYNYYTHEKWRDINNYDLSLNVDKLGVEKTAEMIVKFIKASN